MLKVFLKGPYLTQSGYGHHARTVYRALKTRKDMFDIYVQPIPWGRTSWLWEDDEERREFDNCLTKTINYLNSGGKFDMSIQVTVPQEWEKIAPINIGVTAGIETDKISPKWIEKCLVVDKIITISEHSKNGFLNTVYEAVEEQTGKKVEFKCTTPVESVAYPVLPVEPEKTNFNFTTKFNFLTVAQLSPRKNVGQLLQAFIETFKDNPDVGLIIKANSAKNSLIDRRITTRNFKVLLNKFGPRKCKVYLLHGSLSTAEMAALYTDSTVKALVSTTHGEGYGLPLFEAAYYGLPVIATDWSGHLDFLYMPTKTKSSRTKMKHMFGKISYELKQVQKEAVWEHVITKDSKWAFPELGSIKMNLSDVHKDHGRFKKRAKDLQKWIVENYSEDKIYEDFVSHLAEYHVNVNEEIEDLFNEVAV